jgi:hypothetical protein
VLIASIITSVNYYKITRRYNPENSHLQLKVLLVNKHITQQGCSTLATGNKETKNKEQRNKIVTEDHVHVN